MKTNPPQGCPHDELVRYIGTMKDGEIVKETGKSCLHGCLGEIYHNEDGNTCVMWKTEEGQIGTSFTHGTRRMTDIDTQDELAASLAAREPISYEPSVCALTHRIHDTAMLEALFKDRDDVNSDGIIGACNCLTKTPDIEHHKKGCKYRLIAERNSARLLLGRTKKFLSQLKETRIFYGDSMDIDNHTTEELLVLLRDFENV